MTSIQINREVTFEAGTLNNELLVKVTREGRATISFWLTAGTCDEMIEALTNAKNELEQ